MSGAGGAANAGGGMRGPPPGFGSPTSALSRSGGSGATGGGGSMSSGDGQAGTTSIIKAQISFLLSSLVEDTYAKMANEIRSVSLRPI